MLCVYVSGSIEGSSYGDEVVGHRGKDPPWIGEGRRERKRQRKVQRRYSTRRLNEFFLSLHLVKFLNGTFSFRGLIFSACTPSPGRHHTPTCRGGRKAVLRQLRGVYGHCWMYGLTRRHLGTDWSTSMRLANYCSFLLQEVSVSLCSQQRDREREREELSERERERVLRRVGEEEQKFLFFVSLQG